jgi:DNA-binding response OmpR family regulator
MAAITQPRSSIWIVDPAPYDYVNFVDPAHGADVHIRHFSTGRAALRAARQSEPDLWVVHVVLPDMSGFDLVELLRPRLRGTDLFLVADDYSEVEALRAAMLGATMYLCKPVHSLWLNSWRRRDRVKYGAFVIIRADRP